MKSKTKRIRPEQVPCSPRAKQRLEKISTDRRQTYIVVVDALLDLYDKHYHSQDQGTKRPTGDGVVYAGV